MDPSTWSEFLNRCLIVVLTTVSADGSPHAVPIEVLVRDDRIYSWTEDDSVKAANVRRERRAAVTGYMGNLFAMARGTARTIEPREKAYKGLADGFLQKYNREEVYGNNLFIELAPEHVVYGFGRRVHAART
jgi:nitroimidazol reductase NimA-like FMN-containing flavoprotein (pyridoxamine 5'-phosphate oxidase superfamily)